MRYAHESSREKENARCRSHGGPASEGGIRAGPPSPVFELGRGATFVSVIWEPHRCPTAGEGRTVPREAPINVRNTRSISRALFHPQRRTRPTLGREAARALAREIFPRATRGPTVALRAGAGQ